MFRSTALQSIVLTAVLVAAIVGCTPSQQTNAPTPGGGATSVPAAATAVLSPSETPELPTPAPTITAAPTATPFALQAGWWDNAVCYEIFVRSFYDSNGDGNGDLNGVIQKLDYINDGNPETTTDLGANCVWLMPIMEATSYHGYDVTDYYKVEQDYGTNDDFKRFVEEAHKRGIKVILDLVLNHTSVEHPWFKEAAANVDSPYRDWFLWSKDKPPYKSPWNEEAWHQSSARNEYYYGIFWKGMPDLNYRNPAVTEEAHKISAFWLNDMGADGFRLDAIKHLIENGKVQENTLETHAWLRDYRTFLEQTKPGAFTVGEIFGANTQTLAPYYPDQLDSYFYFDVGDKITSAANFGLALQYNLAIQNAVTKLPYQRFAPFLTNHDQNRIMSTLGDDVSKAKIAATALLTLPGMPFVYYGEEIGMLGQKPDEKIRTPMQWSGEANGGFTAGKPWEDLQKNAAEVNVAAQDDDPNSLLNLYRKLIRLNTEQQALATGDLVPLKTSDGSVGAFMRTTGSESILVVMNFGELEKPGITLSLESSPLAPGTYSLETLLGDGTATDMVIADGGSVNAYAPLPSFAPRTGYVFKLGQGG